MPSPRPTHPSIVHNRHTRRFPTGPTGAVSSLQGKNLPVTEALRDFSVLLAGRVNQPLTLFDTTCLRRWGKKWGTCSLSSITRQDLQRYFADLAQRGATPAEIVAEKTLLRSLYRWAIRCGWTSFDPTHSLERTRTLPKPRAVHWTSAEQRRLLEACASGPGYLRPLVLVGLRTGLRLGHLLNLEWRHVNLTRNRISIPAEEVAAGCSIHVAIDIDTRGVLEQLLQKAFKLGTLRRRVFDVAGLPLWNGRPEEHAVCVAFRAVRRNAGISEGEFDSLRLTFARNCAKACVPIGYPLRIGDWDDPTFVQNVYKEVSGPGALDLFREG